MVRSPRILIRHVGAKRGGPRASARRLLYGDAPFHWEYSRTAAYHHAGLLTLSHSWGSFDRAVGAANPLDSRKTRSDHDSHSSGLSRRKARAPSLCYVARTSHAHR